jgi:16S rRNA (guanine527-N7)-methyltransferase
MNTKDLLGHGLPVTLDDKALDRFERYRAMLSEGNKVANLTAITEDDEVSVKHFNDSLSLYLAVDLNKSLSMADMGSGAGFPGIPVKIAFPDVRLTLIDSLTKRIRFLESVTDALSLDDVTIINDRTEHAALSLQETFDVVTARAFAPLRMLIEMGLPMVRTGGILIAMKGPDVEAEISEAKHALEVLSAHVRAVIRHDLPLSMGQRTLVVIEKTTHVKGYPRAYARMKKQPL